MEEETSRRKQNMKVLAQEGMLLHTGGGLRGCKCREDSRKSIIEETGYHKDALLLEWNMLWGHPRSLGLRIHERKAL